MNKRGFSKTLEATIAIVLILSFIFYFTPSNEGAEAAMPQTVQDAQQFILEQISSDENLRNCALAATTTGTCNDVGCGVIDNFVKKHTPPGYTALCEVCTTANTCSKNVPLDKSVYTDSVFISGAHARVVRVYFWK